MDYPPTTPSPPVEYYRRHVIRVCQLASEATTQAVREHLLDVAAQYERLVDGADAAMRRAQPVTYEGMPRAARVARRIENGSA